MDELHRIIERLAASAPGQACALATLVHVEGSSYRGVGARALALPDGATVGMISGGCLEGDLLERAREVLADGRPRTVRYDSTAPEDALLGLGLGCNGIVDVLLERVAADDAAAQARYLSLLEQARGASRRGVLATVYRSREAEEVGARLALVAAPPAVDRSAKPLVPHAFGHLPCSAPRGGDARSDRHSWSTVTRARRSTRSMVPRCRCCWNAWSRRCRSPYAAQARTRSRW